MFILMDALFVSWCDVSNTNGKWNILHVSKKPQICINAFYWILIWQKTNKQLFRAIWLFARAMSHMNRHFFTRSPFTIIAFQSSLLSVYSAICSFLLAMMLAGTVLDILFIQMPKWRSQEVLAYIANGSDILDERQPLLHNQPAKVFVPKPGRLKVYLRISQQCILET